jgi:hypothetical protein
MCNDYRLKVYAATIGDVFADLKITLRLLEASCAKDIQEGNGGNLHGVY